MDQASILTKQNEQENMEELQGYGQRRGMKWALQCLDLLSFVLMKSFPINHAQLISLSFFSKLRPGNFNSAKKPLEPLLDILGKLAAQCAAAAKMLS